MSPLRYFNSPELDARYRFDGGWVRTGDLGVIDADGYLRIAGRKKDIIVRGGYNISPAETEAALLQAPGHRRGGLRGLCPTSASVSGCAPSWCCADGHARPRWRSSRPPAGRRAGPHQGPRAARGHRRHAPQPDGKILKRVLRERF